MNEIFRFRKYLEYQCRAKTKYYIHSPFVYQFYLNVLEGEVKISAIDKYEKLLCRLVKYFNIQNISTLGYSNSDLKYLFSENPSLKIISFDSSTTSHLENFVPFDFILCRSDLNKQIVLDYFHQCLTRINENSIFVLTNIYQDREVSQTWEEIQAHPQVTLTIDVFKFGICFFRKEKLAKENFVLRY